MSNPKTNQHPSPMVIYVTKIFKEFTSEVAPNSPEAIINQLGGTSLMDEESLEHLAQLAQCTKNLRTRGLSSDEQIRTMLTHPMRGCFNEAEAGMDATDATPAFLNSVQVVKMLLENANRIKSTPKTSVDTPQIV